MAVLNVSAVIVTRGDVPHYKVVNSLPRGWEVLVWDNFRESVYRGIAGEGMLDKVASVSDMAVYGRYVALEYASNDLIFVQDDDCVVSDPQAIVNEWKAMTHFNLRQYPGYPYDHHAVCNMPPEFRHDFYEEHALVGFGSCFHRDAPERAFAQFWAHLGHPEVWGDDFYRTCDLVFTALTPRVLVDVPVTNLPWATDESRMYRQDTHVAERTRMLELVRQVRDA